MAARSTPRLRSRLAWTGAVLLALAPVLALVPMHAGCRPCPLSQTSSDVRVTPMIACLTVSAQHDDGVCCHTPEGVRIENHCSETLNLECCPGWVSPGDTLDYAGGHLSGGRRVASAQLGTTSVTISWVDSFDQVPYAQRVDDDQANGCSVPERPPPDASVPADATTD